VVDCDDDNECTIDLCDTDSGFYYTAVDWDDSSACTLDACDTENGCY